MEKYSVGSLLNVAKEISYSITSGAPFVQVLHTSGSHWILTSNITNDGGHLVDTVGMYDSLPRKSVNHNLAKQICSFYKLPLRCKTMKFDIMNIQLQPNSDDCSIFAQLNKADLDLDLQMLNSIFSGLCDILALPNCASLPELAVSGSVPE